jgi:hypothetical protein
MAFGGTNMEALEKELATYNAKLDSLLKQQGKFVLIKGDEVAGTFDTYSDALKDGYERFGLDSFLVKRIMPTDQVLFISRLIVPCQPSICQ